MKGRPLAAKLFLEGVEVPFIGATITSTVNQATIAYVDMVPHESINEIKPRTLVHLAVKDTSDPAYPYVQAFEGEVFGLSFGKTPNSRTFSISCIDLSSYWDNVLAYFFDTMQSLGKGGEALQVLGLDQIDVNRQDIKTIAYAQSTKSYFRAVITKALKKPGADFLTAFTDLVNSIANVNPFYNLAASRLRLSDRVLLKSSGQLPKLISQGEAIEWFESIVGGMSGFATLRDIIRDLMGIIFHDFVSPAFPSAVTSTQALQQPLINNPPYQPQTVGSFLFKPNLYMLPPPACNIFYPDEYSSFTFNRNFFAEPTRLIYKPVIPTFGNTSQVSLLHVYQPPSFSNFMLKGTTAAAVTGDANIQAPAGQGHFNDTDSSGFNATNSGHKREQNFLTNEELLKGILMAQEGMVPAATPFRAALTQFGQRTFFQGVANYLFYKKRFEGRETQITSHLKLSVVPGFPVLILDVSDAGHSVIAYNSSVTHRIYATQGGYTNTTLSYARRVGEQDQASGAQNEPPIPPWFSAELFGSMKNGQLQVPAALSSFYATLLGPKGSQVITQLKGKTTTVDAVKALVAEYVATSAAGSQSVQNLIDQTTRRNYVKIQQIFDFLGASSPATSMDQPWLQFTGTRLSGLTTAADAAQVKIRRDVILGYRDILKKQRGFHG